MQREERYRIDEHSADIVCLSSSFPYEADVRPAETKARYPTSWLERLDANRKSITALEVALGDPPSPTPTTSPIAFARSPPSYPKNLSSSLSLPLHIPSYLLRSATAHPNPKHSWPQASCLSSLITPPHRTPGPHMPHLRYPSSGQRFWGCASYPLYENLAEVLECILFWAQRSAGRNIAVPVG